MSELKACPFCGDSELVNSSLYEGHVFCTNCGADMHVDIWQSRPIEDGLRAELARLTAELAELREKTRWIPVSERLPEDSGQYICAIRYNEEPKKTWVEQRFWNIFWWDMYTSIVTHWMPLPEPPEATDADN